MSKSFSLKQIAIITFSIDILAMAIAIIRAIFLQRSPMRYFGENGFITWISVIQLLLIAALCWKISIERKTKKSFNFSFRNNPAIFWRITAIGMFFFALDEAFAIHENLDKAFHQFFNREITDFSSRLDDFIILLYISTGLLIIYLFKSEFRKFAASFFWFNWGLFFSFLTITLDTIGHNRENFAFLANNLEELNNIHHWFSTLEEIPKILAEGAFIVSFSQCLKIAHKIKTKSRLS